MAHVMKPGSATASQFAVNSFIPTRTHGWVPANYFAAVPFNSAPPPVPTGMNPQAWMNGQWQQNPMFRPPQAGIAQASIQMWAPHPGWGQAVVQQQQQQQSWKRPINPGDPAYWATKLSDNPLGLENMHIRDDTPPDERHMKDMSNGVPHTPWVWAPRTLDEEAAKAQQQNGAAASRGGQAFPQQQSEKDLPPPPHSARDHARAGSGSRHIYEVTGHVPDRVAPPSAPAAVSSFSEYQQQRQQQQQQQQLLQQQQQQQQQQQRHHESFRTPDRPQTSHQTDHMRQRSRDISPQPKASVSASDYITPASRTARSMTAPAEIEWPGYKDRASGQADRERERRERERERERDRERDRERERDRRRDRDREAVFNTQHELHLTFSPNIVRTPDHYNSPPSRRPSRDDFDQTPSRTPVTQNQIYAPPSGGRGKTPSRSNSLRQAPSSSTAASSSTPPSSSSLGLLTFTEEPQAMLSPLVVGGSPPAREESPVRPYPSGHSVAFWGLPDDRETKVYPKTPLMNERTRSRDRELERDWDRESNATPLPSNRTTPNRTPPSARTPPSGRTPPSARSPDSGSHHARQISRSQTYPGVAYPPPPPIPTTSPRYATQPAPASFASSSYPSSSAYTRTSPNDKSSSRSRAASPLRHNPLPRPPAVSPYTEQQLARGSSSASAAAAQHQHQQQQQQQQQQHQQHHQQYAKRRVRYGFWNRRGDFLLVTERGEKFIVYAPRDAANPDDLRAYPKPTEGFQDHRGEFIKYDPNTPELLDSLPRQGQPPVRPYSEFVRYVEV